VKAIHEQVREDPDQSNTMSTQSSSDNTGQTTKCKVNLTQEKNLGIHYTQLPRDNAKENSLIEALARCTTEYDYAKKYQSEMIEHLSLRCCDPDRFLFWPIYPRDEVSIEGMIMVHTYLQEEFGMIDEIVKDGKATGNYQIHENAMKRLIFLYGDSLSVSNWKNCFLRNAQQLAQFRQKKFIQCILDVHKCVYIQHGLFHHGMHRSEAIFKFFYGGFLQPLQVVLGRKRINGEPAKGKYQDHEQFLLTVYFAVVRYLLRRYMESVAPEDLMFRDSESSVDYLSRIQQQISEYRESWETSKNEPSKMLAMFIKITGSHYRSKLAVSNLDFWMCEYENCEWIGPWKMSNKTTYLRQTCEEIEIKYGGKCGEDTVLPSMSPLALEIMRLNRMCVLTEGGNGVAFDFVNGLYNL